jgi:hypothetical protein
MDVSSDPRFIRGMELFNSGEYLEAGDCFEGESISMLWRAA